MTPTITPSNDLPARLREYNRWQRGDELLEQMHIADIGEMLDEAADRLEELEMKNKTFRAAQKACEDCDAPRVDRIDDLERELEQERHDRKQANLDALRAFGERNDASAIIDATLKALPVGYIPAHTPESLPGRVADLVSELAVWHHEAKRLEAELAKFDETAIEWWCEYQDLKAKALEP
jgi:hypothetical protein